MGKIPKKYIDEIERAISTSWNQYVAVARSILRNREDAEDAVQEVVRRFLDGKRKLPRDEKDTGRWLMESVLGFCRQSVSRRRAGPVVLLGETAAKPSLREAVASVALQAMDEHKSERSFRGWPAKPKDLMLHLTGVVPYGYGKLPPAARVTVQRLRARMKRIIESMGGVDEL